MTSRYGLTRSEMVLVLGTDEGFEDESQVYVGADEDCVLIQQGPDLIAIPYEAWGRFIAEATAIGDRAAALSGVAA